MHIDVPRILRETNRVEAEALFSSRTRTAYLGDNRSLCVALGAYKMYVDTTDVGFSPHIMFDGYWEFWLTKFIADTVKPGDHVADVGANLGYYTLLLSDIVGPDGLVWAIEPNPTLLRMLDWSVRLNGFRRRTRLVDAALVESADLKQVPFFVPFDEPKNGTIVDAGFSHPRGETTTVAARTFDSLNVERLDFIKIDVEGAELAVLKSLERAKEAFSPKIIAEVNFARGYAYDDILKLVGYGGELLHLDFDADIKPLTRRMVAEERTGEDWLVYWPGRGPGPVR